MQKHRPRGVAILAILMILSGVSVFGIASGPLGIVSLALGIVYIIMGWNDRI